MAEQIFPIERIVRDAKQAADEGLPPCVCPHPLASEAARHWAQVYHAQDMQRTADATT